MITLYEMYILYITLYYIIYNMYITLYVIYIISILLYDICYHLHLYKAVGLDSRDGSAERMAKLWLPRPRSCCVHPGRPPVNGS